MCYKDYGSKTKQTYIKIFTAELFFTPQLTFGMDGDSKYSDSEILNTNNQFKTAISTLKFQKINRRIVNDVKVKVSLRKFHRQLALRKKPFMI